MAEIADPGVSVHVITDGRHQVVGFAATTGHELLHFGTAVETWDTGLAASAHDEVIDRFRTAGAAHAHLCVFEENQRARRFYEKLGWKPTGRRSRASVSPHPALQAYELDLRAARPLGHRLSIPEEP